jgi:hypothetical protein
VPGVDLVSEHPIPPRLWINWLLAVAAGVVLFGLFLVVFPSLAKQGFSLLVYASTDNIDSFGAEPVRYIGLAHAVIGGVMVGWGVGLFLVVRSFFARGEPAAWNLVALSVATWFVPDTSYSLASGYWQNALLNTVFLAVFALPLWATRYMRRSDANPSSRTSLASQALK